MTETPDVLLKKVQGCLYGGAIGDAMGGVAEWRTPDEIRERYGYITDLVEAWDGPADQSGRGDGRYTDDSHMVQLLIRCYHRAWRSSGCPRVFSPHRSDDRV